jgi:hypothetical protein
VSAVTSLFGHFTIGDPAGLGKRTIEDLLAL